MIFEPQDFDAMGEADVREDIIAPLLRHLGYKLGTENNIIREQSLLLRYAKDYFGRKDPKKDLPLRGRADYICEVDKSIRWVIEAKPPTVEISINDIEQAYSYARHPEVRAVFFCVCNGRELKVYQTDRAPESALLLCLSYEDFNNKFDVIENVLSPTAIRRDWPPLEIDTGKPLGPGLRSIVRIIGGHIEYTYNSLNNPLLNDLILTITDGAIERTEEGKLVALLNTISPFASAQKLNEKIGMNQFEVTSNDTVASTDSNHPTTFVAHRRIIIPQGEKVLGNVIPFNITCDTETIAQGFLTDHVFAGTFRLKMKYSGPLGTIEMRGTFEIHVA